MQLPCGYIYECGWVLVWLYLPALFAKVYLLSTPRMLVWVVEHAQVPGSWTEAVAIHRGRDSVWGRGLLAHSLSTSTNLISTVFPTWGRKVKDECTCRNGVQTCCMTILGEGRPLLERVFIPGPRVPSHHTQSQLLRPQWCLDHRAQGRRRAWSGRRMQEKSRWTARAVGRARMAKKNEFIWQSSTWWGG